MNSSNESQNINLILKSDDNNNNNNKSISISIIKIMAYMKKYVFIWLALAVLTVGAVFLYKLLSYHSDPYISSLISFTYKGVEKGLDPVGNKFDINMLKSPSVIANALEKLEIDMDKLNDVRGSIKIDGFIPEDAMDRITAYQSIYERGTASNELAVVNAILDISYYPTQYRVTFKYGHTGLTRTESIDVLNAILDSYREYFLDAYGYKKALGESISAVNYMDYDYSESLDLFKASLNSLNSYVNRLASEDTTRFRSNVTGYTFTDLNEKIKTVQRIDIDILSSYISIHNITKDKDSLITYYRFRIDDLTRSKAVLEDKLTTIVESIADYQKDEIVVFGSNTDGSISFSQSTSEYDNLIKQRIDCITNLSETIQQIGYYESRIDNLISSPVGTGAKIEKVQQDLESLNTKVKDIIQNVNLTADEYYENVSLNKAYNILVPANGSQQNQSQLSFLVKSSVKPIIIAEALVILLYAGFAFIKTIIDVLKASDADKEAENNS